MQGSFSHTWLMWETVLGLIGAGKIPADKIIGWKGSLADWETAVQKMKDGEVLKSMFLPSLS